ncbi:hypothetical protein [Salarchaeum japonicum]|uniref:hypothetical protein n=1 Tax=Salarchaeum japonicum TaxID=555573 RepID=UPI003C76ED41
MQYVVGVSATITAGGAAFAAGYARRGFQEARASHRLLTGDDDVETDQGVVGRLDDVEELAEETEREVGEVKRALHQKDLLEP